MSTNTDPDTTRGLYTKYRVFRADNANDPNAEYFVLRLDKRAGPEMAAMAAYARACEAEYPQLAQDLRARYDLPYSESLRRELAQALNRHSAENASGTPDFVLAAYLLDCLAAFDSAVKARAQFFGDPEDTARVARSIPSIK